MLKLFSKPLILLIGVLCVLTRAPVIFAFSIGELQVQSKFGEKFSASFKINLDFDGDVELGFGKEKDYHKLGLERQDLIDALVLDPIQPGKGLTKKVQIRSENPLFFPSFNLLVKATHNGGTLIENFLVTVAFNQSLVLHVGGKKQRTPKLPQKNVRPKPTVTQIPPVQEELEQEGEKEREESTNPQNFARTRKLKISVEESKAASEVFPEKPGVLLVEAITPVPVIEEVKHRRRISGAIWSHPRPVPRLKPETSIRGAGTKTGVAIDKISMFPKNSTSLKKGYILKKGESLFSVSKKVKTGNYNWVQIAVAIWMKNIDKFVIGNINGIQKSAELDLENLEDYISGIDLDTARRILKDQTVEWILAKDASRKKLTDPEQTVLEIPLPSEKVEGLSDLFEQVQGWQTTWVNMDIEGHLAYYRSLPPPPLLTNKKRFLARHPKPRLATSSKMLMLNEGVPRVFFKQTFSSDTLKSRGLKELEWTRTPSGWKIRDDKFYESSSLTLQEGLERQTKKQIHVEKSLKLSFVIHVSSHARKSLATSLTNQLRESGFDAYSVPVSISKEIRIYRVYVGRFWNWNQAHRMVRILRKNPFGAHATAIPYPFALQVRESTSLTEARKLLESLRKSGISGLLLVSYKEPDGIFFRVVVGAFKKTDNATWVLQQLKQSGFSGKLVSP